MARGKKHMAEQIVNLLRQVEVGVAKAKTLPQACKTSRDHGAGLLLAAGSVFASFLNKFGPLVQAY